MTRPVTRSSLRNRVGGILTACVLALGLSATAWAADPDALWKIVHGRCVVHESEAHDPAPCAVADLAGGYAVLKDRVGATQYLLIPTARITGIESPLLLAPTAPNYWQAAWNARDLVERSAGKAIPRDDLGLAVNSEFGRSQNQLHIHIDCIRADVKQALQAHASEIGTFWSPLGVALAGYRYVAMRISGSDLDGDDPFRMLAGSDPRARADMGR